MKNISDLKVVAVGGGTGLSTMLRGIKLYTKNINVIVTVADDGGGSGMIREDLNILPPGDIRNCLTALAEAEPIMKQLFRYRFKCGRLQGQSFGNLFLAAMCDVSGDFETAIEKMSSVLAVTGNVLPVTKDDVNLEAVLKNGNIVIGESHIPVACIEQQTGIDHIRLTPDNVCAFDKCIRAINEADVVILGPGSLYTSIIPNLLVDGISFALSATSAKKIYVCNVMSQPGETDGYTAADHINAIVSHVGENYIDYCIVNSQHMPDDIVDRYHRENAYEVQIDKDKFENMPTQLITKDLLYYDKENMKLRHDYIKLAQTILELARG
ncbi:MAG: YvcK family protein [Clostridia bacterium]|nr:YvcK family protein [Clostridia bacterium]